MSDGFDLRALVREVVKNATVADPAFIVKEVNAKIALPDRDTALEEALRPYVLTFLSQMRMSNRAATRAVSGRSGKVAGIREAWRRILRDVITVGPGDGDWKFLSDCTADDLDFAASLREEHARRNQAIADQYRHLAELLPEHDVPTVGALPEDVLRDVLEVGE